MATQSDLDTLYLAGEGVVGDTAEAIKWFQQAAEQGYAMAQYNLNVIYDGGQGMMHDFSESSSPWTT